MATAQTNPARRFHAAAAALLAVTLAACGATDGATSVEEAVALADAGAQAGDPQLKAGTTSSSISPSITFSPATVTAGQSTTVTVTLGFSSSGGVLVPIGFPGAVLAGPRYVRVPGGQRSVTFTLVANPYLAAPTAATIVARTGSPYPATFQSAILNVVPGAAAGGTAPRVASVQLGAAAVTSGTPVSAVVTLSAPAPAAGLAVQVGLSNDALMLDLAVPPVVKVPAGATSATFTVQTHLTTAGVTTLTDFVVANVYAGPFAGAALTVTR